MGKTANSQVAVFGCLCNTKHAALVDTRLYLPKSWVNDRARCQEAIILRDFFEEYNFRKHHQGIGHKIPFDLFRQQMVA